MGAFRAGVDIGGTFTDIVLLGEEGERYTKKVSSTVDDYARAIVDGLGELLAEIGGGRIVELLHGTTVASNAILEHKGARTGLITTRGFRDVLEIRNLRMPRLYDMSWTKPPPLVERRLRVEVDERIDAQGRIDTPLDEASVERAVDFLVAEGVEAIAVCLLHSYLNPAHEERVKAIVARRAPETTLCISACTPTTPAAGPDSMMCIGVTAAALAVVSPPFDCIRSSGTSMPMRAASPIRRLR